MLALRQLIAGSAESRDGESTVSNHCICPRTALRPRSRSSGAGAISSSVRRPTSLVISSAEIERLPHFRTRVVPRPRRQPLAVDVVTNRIPFRVEPMLATLVAEPFDRPGWVYEEKYDGDRVLAYKEGDRVRLLSRNGKDRTERLPQIAAAIRGLPSDTLLLDGEVVVFDSKGVSR